MLRSMGESREGVAACGEEAGVCRWEYSGVFHAPREGTEWMDDKLEGLLLEWRSRGSGSGTESVLTACRVWTPVSVLPFWLLTASQYRLF